MANEPPHSWMQLCVEKGLCNKGVDALSCLHTAVSKGFQYEQLKTLVQLFVGHGLLSSGEGDSFMADIPLGAQADEEEAEVTDALLTDPGSEYGSLLPNTNYWASWDRQVICPECSSCSLQEEWSSGCIACTKWCSSTSE